MRTFTITTGVYNTKNYNSKEYKYEKSALKFLKRIGFPFNELTNFSWSHNGKQYRVSIDKI